MLRKQIRCLRKLIDDNRGALFLVEGKNDSKVLAELGLKNIISISGASLNRVVERAERMREKPSSIVILTDFDKEGNEIAKRLEAMLRPSAFRINTKARKLFRKLMSVMNIEEFDPQIINDERHEKEMNTRAFSNKKKS